MVERKYIIANGHHHKHVPEHKRLRHIGERSDSGDMLPVCGNMFVVHPKVVKLPSSARLCGICDKDGDGIPDA